ncbi:hypothetical protein DL93DRAFT_20412 [Clavulina sp. PMI_390]|nr:hypothetical protein DL93DRAFT_20412 [Clavulina sp. PMI_390]
MALEDKKPPTRLEVAGVVAFYMFAALVMVFVNKAVLNSAPDLPFSLLFIQVLLAVVLLRIAAVFHPQRFRTEPFTFEEARIIFPVNAVGIGGLVFNTFCLRDVDATFFQIARGLLLPITIFVSAIMTRKAPRRNVNLAAAIVSIGFMIGVSPSSNFNSRNPFQSVANTGLIYGISSSFLTAIHAVMGKTQVSRKVPIVQLAYNNNLLCSCLLLPFVFMNGELSKLRDLMMNAENGEFRVFFTGALVTGVFGLFLSLAGLLSIKVTSPVTHMFSGAARSVLQTGLGVLIFGDIVTMHRLASVGIITAGTLYFTWIQNSRSNANATILPIHTPKEERFSDARISEKLGR